MIERRQVALLIHRTVQAINSYQGRVVPDWDEAPAWMREDTYRLIADFVNFPLRHPSEEHERWMRLKKAEGWTWGAERDDAAKKHPLLVEWVELETVDQLKDRVIFEILRCCIDDLREEGE